MKRAIFVKPISHIQIGHVYEHIYCHQLTQHLRDQGLFSYVDYSVGGKTYYDGYIRLEVKLYTERARYYEGLISSFQPIIDEDAISGALLQIMAEKYADVYSIDYDILHASLVSLAAEPWLDLETINLASYKQSRKTQKGLILADRSARQFLNLTLTLALDRGWTSLDTNTESALFVVVANALRENLQEVIADSSFCYSVRDSFQTKSKQLTDVNVFRIDKRQATSLTTEIEVTREFLRTLSKSEFAAHLAAELKAMPPDDTELSEKVSLVIGSAGWHRIATSANINEVLKCMSLSFKIANDRQSLAPLLTD